MRSWVRRRIDAAHARSVQLHSGGTITLATTLNPLKASPADLAFVADIAALLDGYERPMATGTICTADAIAGVRDPALDRRGL